MPLELEGQLTVEQEEAKNGAAAVAVTDPEYPALQLQPAGTFTPLELAGHATAVQLPW